MLRKGWIPTVTGNLSFSAVGNSSSPKRIISAFREINGTQYVIVIIHRRTSDALFGEALNRIFNRDGRFTFFAIGKSEKGTNKGGFHGEIRLVCCAIPDKFRERSRVITENARAQLAQDDDFIRTHEWVDQQACALSKTAGIPPVAAIIKRSGECTVAVPDLLDDESSETLLKQTYYFLRDAAHTHQHHEERSDTILTVYPEIDKIGRKWSERVLFALHRWIIQQKRRKDQIGAIRSTGILAYAEVFRKNHLKENNNISMDRFSSEDLRASLQATEAELALHDNSSRRHIALLSSMLALLFIPVATFTFVADNERMDPPSLQLQFIDLLTRQIFENPIISMLSVLTVLVSISIATIYPKRLTVSTFVSDLTRLSLSFGTYSKVSRFTLGVVFLLVSFRLLISVF